MVEFAHTVFEFWANRLAAFRRRRLREILLIILTPGTNPRCPLN
jgi:hypothetical protein